MFANVSGKRIAIVLIVFGLFAMWRAGTFDHALVNMGLNAKECARNGFGATFCGDELDQYRRNVIDPLQDAAGDLQRSVDDTQDVDDYQSCDDYYSDDPEAAAAFC